MPVKVKKSGAYVDPAGVFVKKNGTYVPATSLLVKINGLWTLVQNSSVSPNPVVILFRQDAMANPRANINVLTSANDPLGTGLKIGNAADLTGTASGIAVSLALPFNQVNNVGNAALSVPGYFNAGELSESWYVDANTAGVTLSGLNPTKSFQLTMAASRNVASTDATRTGDIAITAGTVTNGATTRTLNAANPASGTTANSVTFVVTPTSGGVITFSLARSAGNTGFAYLGGLFIQPVN